jgi:cytidylate kinase
MAILTISRTYGCGAREMARELAQKLGYTVFEKEIVLMLAKKLDRKKEYALEHDELKDMLSSSIIDSVSSRFAFLKKDSISPQEYSEALKDIFLELARQGNVIVVGRGSQFILQGQADVFHIRLVASIEDRIKHLKEQHFLTFSDDTLMQRVKAEDRRRGEFLKTHFHQTGEDPLLYHLTINLSRISKEKAKETILKLID